LQQVNRIMVRRRRAFGNGIYGIRAKHSGKVFDVVGASKKNGARIIQYDWHGGSNQLWSLKVMIDNPDGD
jgi:hypothetical protein